MSDKKKAVFHPSIPKVSYEVPEGDAQGWKDQGWRFTDPAIPAPTVEAPASK